MRHKIIEALTYPRLIIRNRLDLEGCPHHGHYASNTSVCWECSKQHECAWLFSHDEYIALEQKTDGVLVDALEFAIHYISGFCVSEDHDSATCACDTCTWLKFPINGPSCGFHHA